MKTEHWFLGLDSSTQGLKATVIDASLRIRYEKAVNFDADLPEFETKGGAHRANDGLTVTAPPLMWVAALDLLFTRMREDAFAFGNVVAASGSGQQHGSVWLKASAQAALRSLNSEQSLRDQLADIFAVAASPVWMDFSTTAQCRAREEALGGAQALADLTGSRAFERFTGNQIAKIAAQQPEAYARTGRIALVSSFMASLLIGDYAPIDTSDGSGMNLMNIRSRDWDPAAMDCTAAGLQARLGPLVPGHARVGSVHTCFVERFGFMPGCAVIAWSGDNPNSLAGLRLQRTGDVAVSMGTSDTVFGYLTDARPSATEGHIFANPVDPGAYMAMIVFQNGSLMRELIRDEAADGSWQQFSAALTSTPAGNDGCIGFYMREAEITPPVAAAGVHRFNRQGARVERFEPAADVRAVVEGRFLDVRLHGSHVGLQPARILATGGASANREMIQVMADVLQAPVYVAETADSAALGAAYRALHGWHCDRRGAYVPYADVLADAPAFSLAAAPSAGVSRVYDAMLPRYAELESRVAAG